MVADGRDLGGPGADLLALAAHTELTFTAVGPSLTRVAVEHRGWEALSEAQLREDCAEPGGYAAGAFTTGWARILAALAAAVPGGPA